MDSFVLLKKTLPTFIEKLSDEYDVFAPTRKDNIFEYKLISKPSDINLDFVNSRLPPKSILLQQTETLFKFKPGRKGKILPKEISEDKKIIFAIRPCDAKSFSILDTVFDSDFKDSLYLSKRENSVLIGLSCNNPGVNCFCTSFGDSPTSSKFVDILFTDIGEKFFVETISDKGKKLVEKITDLFEKATEEDKNLKDSAEKEAIDTIKRNMKLEGVVEKLDEIFESQLWHSIAMKCIGCGTCTFLCPTCHCFDMQDEATLKEGARIRVWDSCMYSEYTMHASGHNPRPARMNRVRNRVYHKFSYFPKNSEYTACTGCGRCIEFCPVNIDIIDVIAKVREVKV